MALDKYFETDKDVPTRLNQNYIELAIFALFRIDLMNHIKVLSIMSKQFHIAPTSFNDMYYWEFEIYMRYINDLVKEENDAQKAEMDKYGVSDMMSGMKSGKFMKNMTPKMPTMTTPKMDMGSMKF